MNSTLEQTHPRFLVMARKTLRLFIPALLAVTVLTVVVSAPATARAPKIKKPGAPTALAVMAVNTAIVVSWSAPTIDGGSPIVRYQVQVEHAGGTCTTTQTSCTVSGLTNGRKYNVKVEAENARGSGAAARASKVIPTTAADCAYIGPYANLEYCNLANVNLQGVSLASADLIGVASGGITGSPASLPANWSLVDGYLIGVAAVLTNADLSGANLSSADLQGSVLTGADLVGANLTGVNLEEAEPDNADLTDANLTNAFMYETNLTDATLTDANLTDASLAIVTLTGANLTGAILTGVDSVSITGPPSALPSGWIFLAGYLIGPGADLHGASLVGANLSGIDLTDANLTLATLTDANLTEANLTGANTGDANLSGVTWDATTCPDGTDSNNDGDTCFDNLTP
jgi:uncharacterized protein YjbI with pentapeptide repeats